MPHAVSGRAWHELSMRKLITPEQFVTQFIARTKALREAKGWTAADMAKALDIPAERYRKYENRTPMPHELIERFALIAGVSVEYFMTGRRAWRKPDDPIIPGPDDLS